MPRRSQILLRFGRMTLFPLTTAPLEETWVALDLETTGLSNEDDEIIEVGAVRFRGEEVLDTFQSFVDPGKRLDPFVTRLTGITEDDLKGAPRFSSVATALASFVGRSPLVGHNIPFDIGFLERQGFRVTNRRCDTWDLAYVLLPDQSSYALDRLAEWAGNGSHRHHRATEDALATKEVFVKLLERLAVLDVSLVAEIERLAGRSGWVLADVLSSQEAS
ncbi:MAG: 3'-5' exonuclease, partial [Chloroflexi bacterium]|nr:3'-5' exonuclease [Chloroflexota bacterium]